MGHPLSSEAIGDVQAGSRHLFAQGEASEAFFRSLLWGLEGHHTDTAAVLEKGLPPFCTQAPGITVHSGTTTNGGWYIHRRILATGFIYSGSALDI